MLDQQRVDARLRVVDEHIRSEEEHRLEPLVATFGTDPEWHHKPGGELMSGHEAIRGFYGALFEGFPDFFLDIRAKHVAADAVIVEGDFGGTHQGTWMGLAPTGRPARVPFCAIFTFNDDDRLKAEIVYYDRVTLLTQLGAMSSPS
jgi:steroid delta-isomerase-like uncharacterized protein